MFRGMSTPAVAAATAHLTTEHFQPDEVIFRPGTPATACIWSPRERWH